jgi:hypothetical protein
LRKPLKVIKENPEESSEETCKKTIKKTYQTFEETYSKPAKKVPIKPVTVTLSTIKGAKKPLWVPSRDKIKNANMTRFIEFVNKKYGKKFRTYDELYQWSVGSIPDFWVAIWDFAGVKASKKWDKVVDDLKKFPGTKWFPGAKLNFAENLLRYRDDRLAFIFRGETQKLAKMTYKELYHTVPGLAKIA